MKKILLTVLIAGSLFTTTTQAALPENLDKHCAYLINFFDDLAFMIEKDAIKREEQFIIGWEGNESESEKQTWLNAKHMYFMGENGPTVFNWCMGAKVGDYPDAWQ